MLKATTESYTDGHTRSLHDALPIYIATARLALRAAGAGVEVDPDVRLDGREIFAGLRVDIVGETNAAPAGRDHEIVAELDAARAGALDDVVAADRAAAIGDGAPCGGRANRAQIGRAHV